jgi:hypothetical protein
MEPSGSGQEPFPFSCVDDKEPSCSIKLGELLERLRFQILMAVEVLLAVFWVVTSCSFVGGYRRFGETYRFQCVFNVYPEYDGDTFLRNVGSDLQDCTA